MQTKGDLEIIVNTINQRFDTFEITVERKITIAVNAAKEALRKEIAAAEERVKVEILVSRVEAKEEILISREEAKEEILAAKAEAKLDNLELRAEIGKIARSLKRRIELLEEETGLPNPHKN